MSEHVPVSSALNARCRPSLRAASFVLGVLLTAACGSDPDEDPYRPGVDGGVIRDGGSTPKGDGGSETLSAGEQAPLGNFGMLKDIEKGSSGSSVRAFTRSGDRVFFVANIETTPSLWVTDGTREGTVKLPEVQPFAHYVGSLGEINGKVIFASWSKTAKKEQIWVSDGTPDGTQVLIDASLEGNGAIITSERYVRVGDKLYFPARTDSHGTELYVTDGTSEGTQRLTDIAPGAEHGVVQATYGRWAHGWNGKLYFYGAEAYQDVQLFVTDGTEAGTQRLTDGEPLSGVSGGSFDIAVVGDRLYFTYGTKLTGVELWVTDGTEAGTRIHNNIYPDQPTYGIGAYPRSFQVLGDRLLFQAQGQGRSGDSLWATDASSSSAVEIGLVNGKKGFEAASRYMKLGSDRLVFTGRPPGDYKNSKLWVTDGTSAGTHVISDVNSLSDQHYAALGDKVVFLGAKEYEVDFEPWISDGTQAGTTRIKDLYPGEEGSVTATKESLVSLGGKVYFSGTVGAGDARLFETDGTAEGTKELAPSSATRTAKTTGQENPSRVDDHPSPFGPLFVFDGVLLLGANFHDDGDELYRFAP